jgi:tRNA threonylcarbamoyl adenosine modification protein YeaZ
LAPELESLLAWCRRQVATPDFLSVAIGPGSFTGLRIGVTAGKTLAYALGLPIVAVDSLQAVAATLLHDASEVEAIVVGLNAYRGQVYAGRYHRADLLSPLDAVNRNEDEPPRRPGLGTEILGRERWCERLAELPPHYLLTGDSAVFRGVDPSRVRKRDSVDAVGVGLVGLRQARRSAWVDPVALAPQYLKPSAAEEQAASRPR